MIKAVGVPIPIPADVVILAAATGSASGKLNPWQTFAVLLIAMVGGGIIQFLLARGPGRNVLYRYGRFIGLTCPRLDVAFRRVENVGVLGIALAVVTPAIRTAAIPACGLTAIRLRSYVSGLFLGTTAYIAFQFFLAYGFVKLMLKFWNSDHRIWLWLILIPVASLTTWMVVRHRSRHLGNPLLEDASVPASLRCPLCLFTRATARLGRRQRKISPNNSEPASRKAPPVNISSSANKRIPVKS